MHELVTVEARDTLQLHLRNSDKEKIVMSKCVGSLAKIEQTVFIHTDSIQCCRPFDSGPYKVQQVTLVQYGSPGLPNTDGGRGASRVQQGYDHSVVGNGL